MKLVKFYEGMSYRLVSCCDLRRIDRESMVVVAVEDKVDPYGNRIVDSISLTDGNGEPYVLNALDPIVFDSVGEAARNGELMGEQPWFTEVAGIISSASVLVGYDLVDRIMPVLSSSGVEVSEGVALCDVMLDCAEITAFYRRVPKDYRPSLEACATFCGYKLPAEFTAEDVEPTDAAVETCRGCMNVLMDLWGDLID